MHFVAALDSVPEMRAALCLFEGVATGAADGYARMADSPAATLLHLGPGLGNGLANLHNARKGRVPIVNIIGDHATYHARHDAPLQSDIETVARNVSTWVRTSTASGELARDAVQAIAAAAGPPGQVATLIAPADVSWGDGAEPAPPPPRPHPRAVDSDVIDAVAGALRDHKRSAILLGGRALRERGLTAAGRIAAAAGARLLTEVFPTRLERGVGLPNPERLAYIPELASAQLAGLERLILADSRPPVSFFAYPGRNGYLVPEGCEVHRLGEPEDDVLGGLESIVEALGAVGERPALQEPLARSRPAGPLSADVVCQAVAAVLPEGAIVSDETLTSGFTLAARTGGAPRHDWLTLTGGAIGQGLPVALGAAVARPDRPVIALEADGASLYTVQSLWTMAREQLDVTVVIFNNRSYAILNFELGRLGVSGAGPHAKAQLDLSDPDLDFVQIGNGFGVPSSRATSAEEFTDLLARAIAEPGPHLLEVVVPSVFSPRRLRAMPYALRALQALPAPLARAVKRRVYP